ncbi:MAG: hypothetical protein E7A62_02765 [Actinomycetaceae bacterium]|nr:hypothetical protein [Actinomycetaceae bacterium]MDU0969903.1 hypothetical protein [Actinomycetaceae bacterium]
MDEYLFTVKIRCGRTWVPQHSRNGQPPIVAIFDREQGAETTLWTRRPWGDTSAPYWLYDVKWALREAKGWLRGEESKPTLVTAEAIKEYLGHPEDAAVFRARLISDTVECKKYVSWLESLTPYERKMEQRIIARSGTPTSGSPAIIMDYGQQELTCGICKTSFAIKDAPLSLALDKLEGNARQGNPAVKATTTNTVDIVKLAIRCGITLGMPPADTVSLQS